VCLRTDTPAQYGGLDKYVLNTKADLLGWEGMRLRVAVREAQERNALEASSSPSQAPTPGASANSSDLHSSSHSHFRSSSPIDIDYSISYTAFTSRCYVPKTPFSLGCVSRLTSRGGAKMVCHHTAMVGKNAPGRARAPEAASFHNRLTGAAAIPKTPVRCMGPVAPTRAS
jgi:hypothetical protein